MKKIIVILMFLAGCAPNSLEDFQQEGEALSRKLISILQTINSREELQRALPVLEKEFEQLVDIIIEARSYQINHPEDASLYDSSESDLLREELERIYEIEGGRESIEKAQHEALLRLDAFEKHILRQQQLIRR